MRPEWRLISIDTLYRGSNMSPRKRKKLVHLEHIGVELEARKFDKSSKRGIKKFCTGTIDIENIIDWECENYDQVYK